MKRSWLQKSYWGLVKTENLFGHFFLLVIRLYWGILLFQIGLSKWTNIGETAEFFTTLQIPLPSFSAWLAGLIELLGGIALVLGLFSRPMTLILVVFFLIAYATAHTAAILNIFVEPAAFTAEHPFLYLFTSLVVLSFGPGFISFDYWIERAVFGKSLS